MSRFKSIRNKINKKSSISVDEKLAALDKELEKTGMSNVSEMMTTDNVYSTSTYVPEVPEVTSEVPDPGGDTGITTPNWQQPLGNGADGDPASAAPTSFPRIWNNAGYLDPTDGLLNKSDLNGDGSDLPLFDTDQLDWQDPADVPAGAVGGVQIEVGGMDPGVRGGYLSSGGFTQTTGNLGGVTFKTHPDLFKPVNYWVPFSIFNPFIDSYWPNNSAGNTPQYQGIVKGSEDGSGGAPMALFTAYVYTGGRATYISQHGKPPTTIDPIRRGLEDEPIYPGPIAALFGFGQRAFDWLFGKAKKNKKSYGKKGKPNKPGSGFPDPKPEPDPTKPEPDPKDYPDPDVTGDDGTTFGPNKGQPKKEPKYKTNKKKNKPDMKGGISSESIKNAFDYLKNTAKFYGGVPTAAKNMLYHTNVQNPDHPEHRKHDPSSDNYEGPKEVVFNPIEQAQTDKNINDIINGLNGGKGPKDPNKLSVDEINELSTGMNAKYNENPTWYNTFHSLPTHNGPDGKPISKVTKNEFGGWSVESNYFFTDDEDASDPFSNAFAKTPFWTPRKATMKAAKQNKDNPDANKFIIKKTGEVIGGQFNTQQVYKGNRPRTFSGGVVKESYITEGVGLGLYEPEAMNVDLADIRKGIMPEYPKKPPAEMIDGYHQDSKIRPKNIKDEEPYLKIDRTDLIRSHRLKKSEADEMMDTINMINDYIKKHPEDLIHAQIRYPVDDPRLAELNWKMDQMNEASKEYMDSNFKENKKLFKRATDRTKKNIKLTDPEYVQQKYDELRGTPKPKNTKLVGRLGKHLNKYESKSFFKHVNSKNFKKISERKLEKEKFLEKQEQERLDYINDINSEMDEFRSDWRKDISESDFTNITKGNKVGQTFQHATGATITIDNTMSDPSDQPSQVTLDLGFGEKITVDAPSGNEYGIAGVTKPLDKKVMQKQSVKTAQEINDQIDASEKASESKSARVPIETGDLGYKSTDEILADVGDQWTYLEYMSMLDAIADKAAAAEEPIAKAIAEYSPTGSTPGDVPISLIDAQEAITNARNKAEQALYLAWERYNKVPDLSGEYGMNPARDWETEARPDLNMYGINKIDPKQFDNRRNDPPDDVPPGFPDPKKDPDAYYKYGSEKTDPVSNTQGEFMPSNPQGMRQQGVGKSANDLGRHSPDTSGTVSTTNNPLQALMKAGTKLPGLDRYQTPVNTMISYDKFLNDMGKNKSSSDVKGSTEDNRIDITNSISKNDKNYIESELSKISSATSGDKILSFNNSLKALSKSNTEESDVNVAKETIKQEFAKVYLDKAGLVSTFGGTGDPKTGANPALPEVLNVKETDGYYEVTMGKSYAFRPGGSEPDSKFLKFIGVEPDTVGSDSLSGLGAPIAAKLGITADDKFFKKKDDPFSLYNSPEMFYKVTIKIYKKKKIKESNTFSKLKKIRNK